MSRNPNSLRAFNLADSLVVETYRQTKDFSREEYFGLRAQIRRAAVSVPANIVEGSARRSTREYLHFVNIAVGSVFEVRYLLDLAARLDFMPVAPSEDLVARYTILAKSLLRLVSALELKP